MKIVIGAGGIGQDGFVTTDKQILDVLDAASFLRICKPGAVEVFFAEHVWEHFTEADGEIGARNCLPYLKPGGLLRIAVPDAFHPDKNYSDWVRPGGTGPGSDSHHVFYNHRTLSAMLLRASFASASPVEWWDADGRFHFVNWDPAMGLVRRSMNFDYRNKSKPLSYTSLIVDAIKALEP